MSRFIRKCLGTNGTGTYKYYDDTFKEIITEGALKKGKKIGEWKGYQNNKLWFVEYFENGELKKGKSFDDDGKENSYGKEREVFPMPKHGMLDFSKFVEHNFHLPKTVGSEFYNTKITLTFIVEKDGSLTEIKPVRILAPMEIYEEAIRVLKQTSPWTPGKQRGKNVRVAYTIPMMVGNGA